MLHDLRFAVRVALRTPVITAAAVVSLALAVGANTTIFSVLKNVILAPLPYPQADRLMAVQETQPGPGWSDPAVSRLNLDDFRTGSRSFERLAAFRGHSLKVTSSGGPEVLPVGHVDADFLPLFGASATLGRLFSAGELAPGRNTVAVISERLWRSRFGADPAVAGRTLVIDGKRFTIAGVTAFQYLYGRDYDIWVPITNDPELNLPRAARNLEVYGLLRPGVSPQEAQADLNTVMANIARSDGNFAGCGARVSSLADEYAGSSRRLVYLLQFAVGFVLLIACANIASLLARSSARRRELCMRLALGASKFRLLRECLVESALLASLGGAVGLAVAAWGVDLARRFAPLPRMDLIALDLESLAVAFGFILFAALIAGLTPVLRTAEVSITEALRGTPRAAYPDIRSRSTRDILVAAQISLAFALLAAAAFWMSSSRYRCDVAMGVNCTVQQVSERRG